VKGGFLNEGKLLDGEDFLMGFWLKGNCWRVNCWREDCWREKNCGRGTTKKELLKVKIEHGTVQVCTENFIPRL
jgi:hypothetical protein